MDPPTWKLLSAFAAVYLIWGSTYLAIRFAIETLPPFSMAAVRFVVAGGILYVIARARAPRPTLPQWRSAAIIGILLLAVGNGGVVWAQQWIPSGLTALMVATSSIWMVLVDWRFAGGSRPGRGLSLGLVMGLVGVGLLVSSEQVGFGRREGLLGAMVIVLAALSWASGSIYSRYADLPRSLALASAMEMLVGGAVLGVVALASGEVADFGTRTVSLKSALALGYLIVFGALIGFSCYIWLLRVTTPARVSTYAYVNPAVAVLLGWLLADEHLDLRAALAVLIILSAVVVVTLKGGARPPPASTPAGGD